MSESVRLALGRSPIPSKTNKVNQQGETPLHCAARNGNYDAVMNLLLQGASVMARDNCGWTPLHEACNHGNFDIVYLLIQHGAKVNDQGGIHCDMMTPLHDASQNGHIEIVRLLIESGASINLRNIDGKTPLELVQDAIKIDDLELKNNSIKTIYENRKKVGTFLSKLQWIPPTDKEKQLFLTADNDNEGIDFSIFTEQTDKIERKIENVPPFFQEKLHVSAEHWSGSDTESIPESLSDSDSKSSILEVPIIPEDVPVIKDCIIVVDDDIGTKREHQPEIKYKESDKQKQNVSHSIHKPKKNKFFKSKKRREKRIGGRTNASSSYFSNKVEIPAANSSINMKQSDLFRVRIRINDKIFLISVPKETQLRIEWLVDKARARYENICGVPTKLLLKTQDGALLNPSDFIMDVVMNDEELVGEVTALDFPPGIERYRNNCKISNVQIISEVEEQLSLSLNDILLNEMFLSKLSLGAICNSVSYNTSLTMIDLSHTFIGDINFSLIVDVLKSLPSLNTLICTCISITTKGLQQLSAILLEYIEEDYRLVMKKPPLMNLSKLYLDHNDFSNQKQFIQSMSKLLSHCKNITEINLESCQLRNEIFHSYSRFLPALKESQVSKLNLSYNYFGGKDFFSNLFQSLNRNCIRSLDLGNSLHSDRKGFSDMWKQLENLHQLKELKLSSLSDCYMSDIGTGVSSIEIFSMSDPNIDSITMISISKCFKYLNNLACLDLSCLKNLDNDVLESLLQELKSKKSLKKLLLYNCSIQSPLTDTIFLELGLFCNSLCFIDLSYNTIEEEDKNRLNIAWCAVHRNNASKEFTHVKCVLMKK